MIKNTPFLVEKFLTTKEQKCQILSLNLNSSYYFSYTHRILIVWQWSSVFKDSRTCFHLSTVKPKPKVISPTNHKGRSWQSNEPIKTRKFYVRELSNWMKTWREIGEPIAKRSNARPKNASYLEFDTQLKTALKNRG